MVGLEVAAFRMVPLPPSDAGTCIALPEPIACSIETTAVPFGACSLGMPSGALIVGRQARDRS
jgi:hypothetical protein